MGARYSGNCAPGVNTTPPFGSVVELEEDGDLRLPDDAPRLCSVTVSGGTPDAWLRFSASRKSRVKASLSESVNCFCCQLYDWLIEVDSKIETGGHTANAFAPLVKEVIAYDLTPQMLEAASRFIEGNGHKNVTFVQGDAEALPFESETFDYVTCRLAAHHFPRVDLFIQESYRVLKRDGYLLLIDNVAPEREELDQFYNGIEKERDHTHHRAWKKSEWIRFLEEEGFLIEVMIRYEKRFHFPDWCDRVQLSSPERESLTQKILSAAPFIKGYFNVEIVDHQVIGFTAESVLIKAKKGGKNPSQI